MSEVIRVVLADDHPLLRAGVAQMLGREADFEVVGEGASAAEALMLVRDLQPDILMLDLDMPGTGLSAARAVAADFPAVKIVVLTASADEDQLRAALKDGAHAYVLKGSPARDLVAILRAVKGGQGYVPPALAASLLSEPAASRVTGPAEAPLTEREEQVLERLALGLSNKEIGQQLHLTEKTVKYHVTGILQKLRVRNRVEAALAARKKSSAESRD